jgi:type IV secretory pathway VirB4 component
MATPSLPTQEFVPIKEVRDGTVILKDGSLRAVLLTSSVNFALKSEDEQKSIIFQFQNFLNSLDFPLQVFIQSRKLDIRPYIAILEERYKEQTSDLLKIQTREYIEFIKTFTDSSNIMTKSFFIVIPYSPTLIQTGRGVGGNVDTLKSTLLGREQNAGMSGSQTLAEFEEHRTQLEQRIAIVEQGLTRVGIRLVQLGTEEVIELFYKLFNPGELDKPIKLG